MAIFKSGEVLGTYVFTCFCCLFLLIAMDCQCVDSILIWTAPPPAWNQTVPGTNEQANLQTAVIPVRNGSTNYQLRWNYTLLDGQSLSITTFSVGDDTTQQDIGFIITPGMPSESTTINNVDDYPTRFSLQSNLEFSTLTINSVTEREKATFRCKLQVGSNQWAYNIRIDVTDPPDIIHPPENETVNQNDTVTLNCTADGYPSPNITWKRLSDNSVITFPLNITGKHDEGAYRCTADNGIGNPATAEAFITVQNFSPIHTNLTTNLSDNTVLVNEGINLVCSAMASPPPKYELYKEQQSMVVSPNGSSSFVYPTSVSERVEQVIFSCTPFNDYGYGPTDTVTVTVLYSPEIDSPPSNETVVEGNGVTLFCNATGNPQPNVTWTKQGINTVLSSSETLNLTNLTRGDNGVVYKCKVANYLNSAEATATITVSYSPTVTIQQCSTPVNESDNAMLYCNATGNPVPDTAWIKGGKVEYNKMLIISNISRDESGSYECLAWNGIGKNSSKSCTVDVQYPPKLIVKPLPQQVVEGNEVTLFCNATGNPQPSITWTKQGNNTVLSSSETLTLKNLTRRDNRAVYECKVQNNLGSDEATATITVLCEPSVTFQ